MCKEDFRGVCNCKNYDVNYSIIVFDFILLICFFICRLKI